MTYAVGKLEATLNMSHFLNIKLLSTSSQRVSTLELVQFELVQFELVR